MNTAIIGLVFLFAALSIAFLAVSAVARNRARTADDPLIRDLIDGNRFRFRDGMHSTNWSRVEQIGQERWENAVKAQERLKS